jgi:hypothetical protein
MLAAGCAKGTTPSSSGGGGGDVDQNAPVTITIGDRPTPDKPNDIKAFDPRKKETWGNARAAWTRFLGS